jgi:hypothetical protein
MQGTHERLDARYTRATRCKVHTSAYVCTTGETAQGQPTTPPHASRGQTRAAPSIQTPPARVAGLGLVGGGDAYLLRCFSVRRFQNKA